MKGRFNMKGKVQLLGKVYETLIETGMSLYALGIGLATPKANMKWEIILAAVFILMARVLIVNLKRSEKFDDRAAMNLIKASAAVLVLVVFALFVLFAVTLAVGRIIIGAGAAAIAAGILLSAYAFAFFVFERQGR
jgi:small-conductance mechanosensitive channel